MACDLCGQMGAKIRHVSRSYGSGDDLLVIENVPVVSCPSCGESYLTAETLLEIERIKLHRQAMAEERPVPVAVFA
ncbi:MAG: type II toxin-antitoxin system MqsA family antitoxin [Anaerolineae bacterium]|nr:type II toxin-antitoxin system MqsA family antitoxin [Anaerolineae bacterium]HNS39648.1 type II toxin-antitoxin system MqsA family antitoxin [Promineifilum sp.]